MAFVEFKDVEKIYEMGSIEVRAVDKMSFKIDEGELCVIVGPSGAGKTTVLHMLGGMDSATAGTIKLGGKKISDMSSRELTEYRRHDIGFVFQFYNLVQNLTALENVELASQICENPLDAREVLEEVGLKGRMNNFPAQLSGGEQQRVAIARALAKNPKLLLCDEPTGALDFKTGKAILELLQKASKEKGQTVAIVTHNSEFTKIADRVIHDVNRGVTILDATGAYSKAPQKVTLIICRRGEASAIYRIIKEIDPKAFITQASVMGVFGEGFDLLKTK